MKRSILVGLWVASVVLVIRPSGKASGDPPLLLRNYQFLTNFSTLHQTGGFAGVDYWMPITGGFGLVTGYDFKFPPPQLVPIAQFIDVDAVAAPSDSRLSDSDRRCAQSVGTRWDVRLVGSASSALRGRRRPGRTDARSGPTLRPVDAPLRRTTPDVATSLTTRSMQSPCRHRSPISTPIAEWTEAIFGFRRRTLAKLIQPFLVCRATPTVTAASMASTFSFGSTSSELISAAHPPRPFPSRQPA